MLNINGRCVTKIHIKLLMETLSPWKRMQSHVSNSKDSIKKKKKKFISITSLHSKKIELLCYFIHTS